MVLSILLYGCETWLKREADERMLATFNNNNSIHHILHVRRKVCVPTSEMRCRLRLTSIPVQLVKGKFRWFGLDARCHEGDLIRDFNLLTPPRTRRRRTGGFLKTGATTFKEDMETLAGPRIFGYARWRKYWVKVSSELEVDRRAWGASIRDVVNSIGDDGSARPGEYRHTCKYK